MADYDSGLPIRSEADGADERVQTKIVDATNPNTQQMEVDTDGNAHAEMHGNNPAGTDVVARLSEEGAVNGDGFYDASNNSEPDSSGLIAHTRVSSRDETHQVKRLTAIDNGAGDKTALDISLHDENGENYTTDNPLPVFISESEDGVKVNDYQTSTNVASDASVDLDYTVTAGKVLIIRGWNASASGKMKLELKIETAPAAGTFNTKYVQFNSTANPQCERSTAVDLEVSAGSIVRATITNRDNQAQDVYFTLEGLEV